MKRFDSIQFSAIFRWMLLLAVLIVPSAVQAESWRAVAGAASSDNAIQALAFLPNELWVHVGDGITWEFVGNEPHSVTFLRPGQIRPPFAVGCPGITPTGSNYDESACVDSGGVFEPRQTYTVRFPTAGNFKLVCLVHPGMTGMVHVLNLSEALPYNQAFYDNQAADERRDLLSRSRRAVSSSNKVVAGIGERVATPGGAEAVSVMRFLEPAIVARVGETVEWNNWDTESPHTITFGIPPNNLNAPSANTTRDADGAPHAQISSPADSVNSGAVAAAGPERLGVAQAAPPFGTRFRVTFTREGIFNYLCGLHVDLGMIGTVIVLPAGVTGELMPTGVTFEPASVRAGGSVTATFTGLGLSAQTYFDLRFRAPGSTTDNVALNWQQGTSGVHTIAAASPTGTWSITGLRAHRELTNFSSPFLSVPASLTVLP